MRLDIRRHWLRSFLAAALVGLFAVGAVGCKKSPKEKLRSAKAAVLNENADEAEKLLAEVLKAEPDNFDAKRQMGKVHQLRENYPKAEEEFQGLWEAQGFGDEAAKLSTEQKSQRQFLQSDLLGLYQDWAASLDAADSPDEFEEVVKKGLEIDPKKVRLNTMLVEFYEGRAKKLVEQGKKLQAAATFEKILELRTMRDKRDMAKERSTNLRFEVNQETFQTYFDDKAKPELEKAERYDADAKAILFSVKTEVSEVEKVLAEKGNKVRLDPRKKQHQMIVHKYTVQEKLKPALVDVVVEATGIPDDSDFSKVQPPKGFEIVEVEPNRRDYTVKAKIPVKAVLKLGFEVKEQTRKAAEEAAEDGGDKAKEDKAAKAKADQEK